MEGFRVREHSSASVLWAGSPDHISAHPHLTHTPRFCPEYLQGPEGCLPPRLPGPLTRPVSSASPPSVSSTTLAKLLALDEEREKSFSTSALWAVVSALRRQHLVSLCLLRALHPASLPWEAQPAATQAPRWPPRQLPRPQSLPPRLSFLIHGSEHTSPLSKTLLCFPISPDKV